jgi:hypothetical protein
MKIHNIEQRTPEWYAIRRGVFTASGVGEYALEPVRVTLTVDDIKTELDALGIPRKGITKKDDLISLLPDPAKYEELTKGALTAILKSISDEKPKDAWQIEMEDKAEKAMLYNIPVQRGNALEDEARRYYEQRTGYEVTQVGFVTHDTGGFGCSPDGLIYKSRLCEHAGNITIVDDVPAHGLEIKCPMPETHMRYLLDGKLPDDYELQVHMSMAVTGLNRWDFLSYCPGEAQLLLTIERTEYTDKLEAGLKRLVAEKRKIKAKLGALWTAEKERGIA